MPRRVVLALILTHTVAVAALVAIAAWRHECWPRLWNCSRLEKGMTRAEVHEVMGGPPGEYFLPESYPTCVSRNTWLFNEEVWEFNNGEVAVGFTDDGRARAIVVTHAHRCRCHRWELYSRRASKNPWERFQQWMRNDPRPLVVALFPWCDD